jgi:hypothetical protein
MNFIMDSYQSAMSPFLTPPAEAHTRRLLMKKIASQRAPHAVPILDRIEKITKDFEQNKITKNEVVKKIIEITKKYGDENLNKGILTKLQMLEGEEPKQRLEKPIALFSQPITTKRKGLLDFMGDVEAHKKKTTKKRKQTKKRGKKKRWDPWKDDGHPLANSLGRK